jgi:RND family efflux transporter MFP subunit
MGKEMSRLGSIVTFIKKRWKTILIVLLVIGGLAWWNYQRTSANQTPLTFESPKQENLTKTLEVSGTIDADEKARLRYLTGGKLTYLGAEEGSYVEKGKTIAIIDQATLKKQLEQDLNNFMKERLDWDQLNDDVFFNEYTEAEERDIEQGQLDLTNEVLDVEIRDIAIQNTHLHAPFSGIVTHSPTATAGVQLLSTDFFELVNPDSLIFRAEVDEADIALVNPNQQAKIELDAYIDEEVDTYVNYVSFTSSETSNGTVFIVEMPLDATRYGLDHFRIGMNGDVAIELETRQNVLTIPLIALKERDDKTFVDVNVGSDTNQEVEEREITVGLETEEKVEVISGLSLQDQVLIPE